MYAGAVLLEDEDRCVQVASTNSVCGGNYMGRVR